MPAPVLQFKRGNAGVAGTVPALRPGEPAISLNNFDFFIGIDTSVANNKFFGSHRYWGREDGTNALRLKLVDKDGTNSINLKAPNTLAGVTTYTFPATPTADYYLKTSSDGTLSWAAVSLNSFTGIVTFTDATDNTLGNADTGSVQIDGGLGINKNVTIGAGLSVAGQSYFIGTATFYGGQINLGDSDGDNISVAGEFVSNLVPNASNTYDLGLAGKRWRDGYFARNVDITGNLVVDGLVTVGGGTTVILYGEDIFIRNKDIILGYTTSVGGADISDDDTANHAGVAIASTVGTPLASFTASGINTLPNTYKQLMWFKQGTLGFGTDAFAFNYGVAIGTTNMANGVRLAVGSGVTVADTSITATNFYGNASSSDQVKTVTASNNNANYYMTFVDSLNGSATNETVYTDDGIYYNPGANKLTTQHAEFTGNVLVSGISTLAGNVFLGDSGSDLITVAGVTTFTTSNVYIDNQLYVGGLQITGGGAVIGQDITTRHLSVSGVSTFTGAINANGNVTLGDTSGDTITIKGTATFEQPIVGTIGTATRATQVDTTGTSTNADYYVTFVDTLAGQTSETLRVGAGLSINPSTGDVKTTGRLSVGDPAALTSYIKAGGGSDAMYLYANGDVSFQQKVIVGGLRSSSNSNNTLILNDIDARFAGNLAIAGITTIGTGVGITQFSSAVGSGTSTSSVPTSSAVIDYVDSEIGNIDLTLGLNADTGGPSTVNTSQTLTINGTANEVETSVSGQTVTVGLPNTVVVGTSLSAPTIKTATIQHSNGTQAATIDSSGNITASHSLTVSGDLYVNGSTTQVNTTELTVYDRTITLGVTTAGTTPTTTSWDLGLLMNYGDAGVAKTAGVIWKYGNNDVERFQFAANSDNPGSGGDVNAPDITVSTFAPIEIGSLWVTDCAGTSQVISCTGSERFLENITVDAGTF